MFENYYRIYSAFHKTIVSVSQDSLWSTNIFSPDSDKNSDDISQFSLNNVASIWYIHPI